MNRLLNSWKNVNKEIHSVEDGSGYFKEPCGEIASQLVERGVSRFVFYAQRPRATVAYIKILQAALENCRELLRDEDIPDYVARKNIIVVTTRLEQ